MIQHESNRTKYLHEGIETQIDCIETESRHEESGMPRSGPKGWLNTVHAYTGKKMCMGFVNHFVSGPDREVYFRSFWPDGTTFCEVSRELKEEKSTASYYDYNGKRAEKTEVLNKLYLNVWWNNSN